MPFPKLQPMPLAISSGTTNLIRSSFDDNGNESLESYNAKEKLVPPEMMDLETLLKNKIPLEEVSSKLLGKERLTIRSKQTNETTNEQTNETTNEQTNDKEQ